MLPPLLLVALAVATTGFLNASRSDTRGGALVGSHDAEWPPFTLVYQLEQGQAVMVGSRQMESRQVRRFTYRSATEWTDTVIESAPIETRVGTFSAAGSYTRLDGKHYIEFDAVTNSFREEEVEPGARRVPGAFLLPFRMLGFKVAKIKPAQVETSATICFQDDCRENTMGLLYIADNGQEYVFADDSRGLPLRVGTSFLVKELRAEDERR